MERTELQNRAYLYLKKTSKISSRQRLGYNWSKRHGMIHEIYVDGPTSANDMKRSMGSGCTNTIDTPGFFFRHIETVDYPGDKDYKPQEVWLGYKGVEHFLLIPIEPNSFSTEELYGNMKALSERGYNIELNSVSHQSVPEVFHLHAFKKTHGPRS